MANTRPPAENDPQSQTYEAIETILNSLDALVYVTDMQTHEVLFFNAYGTATWGAPDGRKCYQVLQKGQTSPCDFCTNSKLIDEDGNPTGVYVWEFQNTQNGHWYQCRDQAIRWIDGRLVRMEIATDITDRKAMEQNLAQAKNKAEKLADTDELTGLNNRRAFFNSGNALLQRAVQQGKSIAVIIYDLDHFKMINDQWGHAAGDFALQELAQVARRSIRSSDILARLGGEEFVILLPDIDTSHAFSKAEQLRLAVENHSIHYQGENIHCTISLGVTVHDFSNPEAAGEHVVTLDELLNRADKALFEAKVEGRNQAYLKTDSADD